jgi:aminoglycoside N3'-acetyltransferase
MVHSSVSRFVGFRGTLLDALRVLQSVVGQGGTLMMPTMPFTGLASEYARSETLDVRRTPSRMGVLTELLRRLPETVRSVHPTHPVAIWGKNAVELAAGHPTAKTPCGKGSPFHELLVRGGNVLLIDVDIQTMTFFHTLEELYEDRLPHDPFTKEMFHLAARDVAGNLVHTDTRLFDARVAKVRELRRLVPPLKRINAWRETRVGRIHLVLLDCESIRAAYLELCESGVHCYDFARLEVA